MTKETGANDLLWYKDAIIYELHIKAFFDGNGDGTGDFGGLLQKLDYLQELGVTAIWVLPFYPSPLRDDGYDIADYYSIHSRYGNIDQFRQFLHEAHKRGLKVITELVINHTSDQHPWFQRARLAPKDSPDRAYYVWSDDPGRYKDVRIIFQDYEASNWTWDPVAQQYYWHRFFHHQPDLNFDNEAVQEEIFNVLDHWCSLGVDGFRLDAVPYLFERENTNGENLKETHDFLKKLRRHVDEHFPGTVFLAEANMWPEDSASYFGEGDECHMNYHFPVMPRMFMALEQEDRYPITDIFEQTPEIPSSCQWAIFLRNHDELTLEMVTDEERDFMYKVYAKDPKARINLGIRHRLAPLMDNDRRRIELMNALLFSLPGTPVVYYGDEIGMGDNFYLGDRDGVRTPMQWSADRNAGFSKANPHQLYLPLILDPQYTYEAVNVELQRSNTSSLFWFMKRVIAMRRNYPAFGRGSMKFIHVENPKVLAFVRTYEDENILVVINLSKHAQPAEIDLAEFKGFAPLEAFSKNAFPAIRGDQPYFLSLSGHAFQWFILQKKADDSAAAALPPLSVANWQELTELRSKRRLEREILPLYLKGKKWFKGRRRAVHTISIRDSMPVEEAHPSCTLLLVEVLYDSGLPEMYQVVVCFLSAEAAATLRETAPQAVLVPMQLGGQEGILCDAFYTRAFHDLLASSWSGPQSASRTTPGLQYRAQGTGAATPAFQGASSKTNVLDENNTSIHFGNQYFVKLYRKVEYGLQPDVEISLYLGEEKKFPYLPHLIGTFEGNLNSGSITLGILQELVENHGSSRSFLLQRIDNYIERLLARDRQSLHPEFRMGSFAHPIPFDVLPEELKVLIGARTAEHARLLGERTAEMHSALGADSHLKEFIAEEFSLHYQRSLFSSMQSGVRETYDNLLKAINKLDPSLQPVAGTIAGARTEILQTMKKIYVQKLDVQKIRVHGSYTPEKVLLTGKDIVIQDFGGDTTRSYSERRLKRSPMKDVADMVTAFYDLAFEGFAANKQVADTDRLALLPHAAQWAFFTSAIFLQSYFEKVAANPFIPDRRETREIFIHSFLLERAISRLNHRLVTDPAMAAAPLHLLLSILEESRHSGGFKAEN